MNRLRSISLIALLASLAAGCVGLPVTLGQSAPLTCDTFGVSEDAAQIETFLETSERFSYDTHALADELEATCADMAADLGVHVPRATEGQLQVDASCRTLASEIDSILAAAGQAEGTFELTYEAPVCEVDLDAMAGCVAACDLELEADASVECADTVLGRSCYGDSDTRANAQCETACEARVDLTATCSEPVVSIDAGLAIDLEDQVRLDALVESLHANYPRFLALGARVEAIAESGAELANTFEDTADATGRLGLRAMACIADATSDTLESLHTVQISVQVTVEVSASVSAGQS